MTKGPFINKYQPDPLQGSELVIAAIFLAIANFVVVLDMTIVNVSLPHIAGGLAVSTTEGTYAITSYSIAEAVTVPLTGWLASRFGTLRVFIFCIIMFGICSTLCGLSSGINELIVGRMLQGLAGGPIMPLSQTLLMTIFPKNKQGAALGLWSMTTLVAPIAGPVIGGYISDVWTWHYIFFINIPIAFISSIFTFKLLQRFETTTLKTKVDFIGMLLLVFWVGAFQLMLDEGKNYDWFGSTYIRTLAIIAVIGFFCFLIWELTQDNPIINLRVFRHRGFSISVLTLSLTFGAYFGSVVLLPLFLQSYMGYNATSAGFVAGAMGCFAVFMAPIAAKLSDKIDARKLVSIGVIWLGIFTFIRSFASTDMTLEQFRTPMLFQGLGLPLFFVPLTALALRSVNIEERASAAGLMNFLRTLSGAFATSLVTTAWEDQAKVIRTDMAGRIIPTEEIAYMLGDTSVIGQETARYVTENLLQEQAVMLATNQIFIMVSLTFIFAASAIWFAPKPVTIAKSV